jgi:hypothetical protein
MLRRATLLCIGMLCALVSFAVPASAERPILDYHRLDAYFALYARDTTVPWKPATVRLDTFTDAPVDFAVYRVDPAAVIVAGADTQPRAVDTGKLKALARWRYVPPGGFRFQSNDVAVPIGSREGFFVVEARRAGIGEQVWIDSTRVGLLSKETPSGLLLYGADLGTGRPLAHMRVSFISGGRFVDRYTDRDGIIRWRGASRPVFAMAQWGSSTSLISFLPQAPLPGTIVGVKTDSAVVHAGEDLRVVGFARSRSGARLRAARGTAHIVLRSTRAAVAHASVRLDSAGAFATSLHVPAGSAAGEYTLMATVNGATAGATIHVDADAGGLSLSVSPLCTTCDLGADVPLIVRAMRFGMPAAGVTILVNVIRSPHVYPDDVTAQPWGIAQWFTQKVITGTGGSAAVRIPHPADGLASTYGVRVSSGGATAEARVAVPTSALALRVAADRDDIGSGMAAGFRVWGYDAATGKPAAGVPVDVELVHGASVQEQRLRLDDSGKQAGAFTSPEAGSNLLIARSTGDEPAMDAVQLEVEPQTMQMEDAGTGDLRIALDASHYRPGQSVGVTAHVPGAQGDALITLESANETVARVVAVRDGVARATLDAANGTGELSVGAAVVRSGAIEWQTVPLVLDAPGRPLPASLLLDRTQYTAGTLATAVISGVRPGAGTIVVRLTRTDPTGSAAFENAPDLLDVGTTSTQDTAVVGASWHPWVDSTGRHPTIETFARRGEPPRDLTMTQADTASVYWSVDRHAGDTVHFPVPSAAGKYVVTLLKLDDDGRVTAASGDIVVE